MNDYKHDMGLRIKENRKKQNLTQEETAEKLDISVKHFSEVERGLTGLSIENLIKLSNILGVSIDYIVKGDIDIDNWKYTLSELKDIPKNKEETVKKLIKTIIEIAKE